MKKGTTLLIIFCLAFLNGVAQEPTHWRGSQANGIYTESNLLKTWPANGPELLWSFEELGQGHSSAIIVGDNVFSTGMVGETGYLFKFNLSGKLIAKYPYGAEYTSSYIGTRGTPVIVGDLAYLYSGWGKLVCMDHNSGETIWSKELTKDFDGKVIRWGNNETPVIDGDKIYITPGGKNYNVIALNRHNGNLIWSCKGKGEVSAYCTPLLINHNGRKILSTHTASHLLGIDAETGKLLWSHPQPNKYSVHANTPIYKNGDLFYFSGYGQGSGKLKLSQDGGSVSLEWKNQTFDSRMGGAVLVDGFIYGSGDFSRSWQCLDWKTGKSSYESKSLAKGNVIYADGLLYCYSEQGDIAIANATPSAFKVISKTKITKGSEQHWAHIVIHNGILYVRHGSALMAFNIKQ